MPHCSLNVMIISFYGVSGLSPSLLYSQALFVIWCWSGSEAISLCVVGDHTNTQLKDAISLQGSAWDWLLL